MRTQVRRMGNSSGVIIPKSILAQLGLAAGDNLDLVLENGRVVLTPQKEHPRAGWAEASRSLVEAGDDGLAWPEFSNAGDADLRW